MSQTSEAHEKQIEYWNGEGGALWRARAEKTDVMLGPVLAATLERAAPRGGETVIDIGCGCGGSTVALAKNVGDGQVLGLDVSGPMLDLARERAQGVANASFALGDAAVHPFASQSADLVFSRFGVMFFGDPASAFANLRRALKPAGRLVFCCWRAPEENDWMRVPLRAVYAHVPRLPRPGPEDPGPFSFSNPDRVTRILTAAGFAAPRMTPLDLMLDISGGGGLEDAVTDASLVGPASVALSGQSDEVRAAAIADIRKALAQHVTPEGVRLKGAMWIVEAGQAR